MTENEILKENMNENNIRELPVLSARDLVLFPHMVAPWIVEQPNIVKLIDEAMAGDRTIAVVTMSKDSEDEKIVLNKMGTTGLILRMAKNEEGHARLIVQGVSRIRVNEITQEKPYPKAFVEQVEDQVVDDIETQALMVNVKQAFSRIMELSPNIPGELGVLISSIDSSGVLADIVMSHLNIPLEDKQNILETLNTKERLRESLRILTNQLEILELGHKIQTHVKEQMDKTQREYYLREQLKAIKKELGEEETWGGEIEELRSKVEAKGLPEYAREEAERELNRLAKIHPSSSEYTVSRTYIDWILDLPWNETTEEHLDLKLAESYLDEDHYNLEKIKRRILEYLAVRKLKPDMKGPILCFVGPPGTGKTSLGRSIARALGRKFHRISLGGLRDEAEIRGHRRTYVGAMPGRIVQGLRKAGVKNPVFMLDEIDKIGSDFRGDPSSALLEVLDPEQNSTFTDHYLGMEFDLSSIIFIATANVLDTIPSPLLDRMEVLELSGYTFYEKLEIAKRYIIPRQLEVHGLKAAQLKIQPSTLKKIVTHYTREAGVRNLEREIASVCRGVAKKVALGEVEKASVKTKELEEYLGPARFESEVAERTHVPGVATGLAWTSTGGDILFIEAAKMPGSGKLTLTGKLGDVMKESAHAALSYIKSKASELKIQDEAFKDRDIHIHVPAGAIPKDGPSAGIAITVAIVSMFMDTPVRPDVAMTGEITLRGLVLPVGGIKEKVLAAHRAGIKRVILPKRNAADLQEIPQNVRDGLDFHLVSRVDEAINRAFKKT